MRRREIDPGDNLPSRRQPVKRLIVGRDGPAAAAAAATAAGRADCAVALSVITDAVSRALRRFPGRLKPLRLASKSRVSPRDNETNTRHLCHDSTVGRTDGHRGLGRTDSTKSTALGSMLVIES